MLDLLVIGAGLTGLSAAIHAAQAGLSVRVVTKGLSALHWSAGSLDLLGYLPTNTPKDTPVETPLPALAHLPDDHPLRQIETDTVRQSLTDMQSWLAAQGLTYVGDENARNLWLPTGVGARRPVYLAPAAQAAARLDRPDPLLIVGFDHFNDFYPDLIAENLRRQGHPARGHTLPLTLITDRRVVVTPVILAEALDDLTRVEAIGAALRDVVQPGERVVFPAILGVAHHAQVVNTLTNLLGAPVGEIPTLPPSVPGLRLHRALVRTLEQLGGRVESNMAAVEFGTEEFGTEEFGTAGNKITWVATAASARPLRHRAHAYLLATGGILGGGFNSDHTGRTWETVFNLPLTVPTERGTWFRPEFLDRAGHPVFQGGVRVNAMWQPVDASGNVIYGNLWAAGNLLAHADTIRTRSREGVALATGAAAVHALLAHRQQVIA